MTEHFNRNQYIALISSVFLSPALRLYPKQSVILAGGASFMSPAAAFAVMTLYLILLRSFLSRRADGEGLAELTLRALGKYAGGAVLFVSALWILLYCGLVVRSSADRFITTIYPNSSPTVFCVILGLLALTAALGSTTALVRTAKLILPAVFGVLLFALLFSLKSVKTENLDVQVSSIVPAALGAVPALNVISSVLVYPAFLISGMRRDGKSLRAYALWLALMCAMLSLLSIATVGSFGADLTARLEHPFFSMVRNFVILKSVERIEALVVVLWVFPDFLLASLLIMAAFRCLMCAFGKSGEFSGQRLFDFSGGRWLIWLCAAAVTVSSLLLAPTAEALSLWSQRIIPTANMIYVFALVPAVYAVGRIREKI